MNAKISIEEISCEQAWPNIHIIYSRNVWNASSMLLVFHLGYAGKHYDAVYFDQKLYNGKL